MRSWPEVSCVILSSEIEERRHDEFSPPEFRQNLSYGYDAAGQLVGIVDAKLGQTTSYAYDLAGHRLRERMESSTAGMLQDNHLAYDTLGRLIYNADNRVQITFAYDLAGT